MKIAIFNNLYYPEERGGAEKIARVLAERLKEDGYEVLVVATAANGVASRADGVVRISSSYAKLDKKPPIWRLFWHIGNLFSFGNYQELKNILIEFKPDLVITNNLMGVGFLVPLLLRRLRIRHIHILHDIQLLHPSGLVFYGREDILKSFFAEVYQAACRLLFGSPTKIVSPSKWLLEMHEKRGFFKYSEKNIIMNPFSFQGFEDVQKKGLGYLYVGQLEDHKGLVTLLNAFERVREEVGGSLKIIGDGSLSKFVADFARKNDGIVYLGRREKEFVLDSMRHSNFLIMPSLCYENSPTVIYEAASVGLPSIASNIGGAPELVDKFGGLLFEPGNAEDLATKMTKAAREGVELKKVEEDLSVEAYLRKIL